MTYDQKREDKFLFNDIAMIFSGDYDRLSLLGEVELSHISLDGKSNSSSDIDINLERLQLSYALSDDQTIQIGRFDSDIGFWNQAPIPILQETTTTPHITNIYPKASTGLLYRQNLNYENSISLTLQHNPDLAHQSNIASIDRHRAFGYRGVYDAFAWSLSGGLYRKEKIEFTYWGVGAEYEWDSVSLQGEIFTQESKSKDDIPYSGYLQSVWHFSDKQAVVMRFEGYDDESIDTQEQIYLWGYVYRPWANMALKAEYIHHTKLPLKRFVYSLSVLF